MFDVLWKWHPDTDDDWEMETFDNIHDAFLLYDKLIRICGEEVVVIQDNETGKEFWKGEWE